MGTRKCVAVLGVLACALLMGVSCASVSRIETGSAGDLSGTWNENDVQYVCDVMVDDCLGSPAFARFAMAKGGPPVVRVGRFRNDSHEHIETAIITSKMENAILRSGKALFAADRDFLSDIDDEVRHGLSHSDLDSMKSPGAQKGVDYLLQGSVRTIVQKSGREEVRTYYVSAQLTDVETGLVVWQGHNDAISKRIVEAWARF